MFRRFGLVRAERYGLIVTSDDRILSTRPTVLDDGVGGKIVGWRETDLAAMELDHWPAAAKVRAPEARLPAPALAPAPPPAAVAPPPAVAAAPPQRAVGTPVTMPAVSAPTVTPASVVEEDEWEWQIAMARVRPVDTVPTADQPTPPYGTEAGPALVPAGAAPVPPRRMPRSSSPIQPTAPRFGGCAPGAPVGAAARALVPAVEDKVRAQPPANATPRVPRPGRPMGAASPRFVAASRASGLPPIAGKR
jgi:translation initiation factor IF-2